MPKEKKDLYALPVNWAVLEQSSTIEKKMQPWIAKKVTEYFGEKDETVISFVMEEVRAPDLQQRQPNIRHVKPQNVFTVFLGRVVIASPQQLRRTCLMQADCLCYAFVFWQLEKHSSADDMVDNLGPVLADDCDDFVSIM